MELGSSSTGVENMPREVIYCAKRAVGEMIQKSMGLASYEVVEDCLVRNNSCYIVHPDGLVTCIKMVDLNG